MVGRVGPNGAGKSTTISMISTLLPPTKGTVKFNGKDVFKHPKELRPVLGVVPQEIALYEELSAYENMKFFGKVYGLSGKALEDKIQETLELVGLKERQKDAVDTYSGGMKRRINIAVALMHDPEILIMDEPTTGLDPLMRDLFIELLKEEKERGKTIFMSSHIFQEVEEICDRVAVIQKGKIIDIVDMKTIRYNKNKEYRMEFKSEEDFKQFISLGYQINQVKTEDLQVFVQVHDNQINELIQSLKAFDLVYFKEIKVHFEDYITEIFKEEV